MAGKKTQTAPDSPELERLRNKVGLQKAALQDRKNALLEEQAEVDKQIEELDSSLEELETLWAKNQGAFGLFARLAMPGPSGKAATRQRAPRGSSNVSAEEVSALYRRIKAGGSDGLGKTALIGDLTDGQWNNAIAQLKEQGKVSTSGQKRGMVYLAS